MNPPLHLAGLNFTADNIRNIHASDNDYPSRFHATVVIFDTGHTTFDGHANFLEEPFPGVRDNHYMITNVPLSAFDPEIRQINITVHGGRLASDGLLEYSPKVTRVEVNNATIADVGVGYTHSPATQQQEAQRIKEAGQQIERQNNRAAVDIIVRDFELKQFSYTDETANPNYRIWIKDTDLTLRNLSNHQQQGRADVSLRGKSWAAAIARYRGASWQVGDGPAFDLKIAVVNTDLPSLNDFLRSFRRFDVAAGKLAVKDGTIDGYVKPMFADLEVYNYQKDKNTPILHQAKELLAARRTCSKVVVPIWSRAILTSRGA